MTDNTRRGFLAKLGMLATAPVLTAFVPNDETGLVVPDRELQIAREAPPPLVISSITAPFGPTADMDMDDPQWGHHYMHVGDGSLVFYVDGEAWAVQAFKVPAPGQGRTRT